ncbi:type II toxin-antitoxin system VapC family toxin [Sandaracinobacteroides hominis]|uniref:type II toxin-antitoxin system VapC family toxin n=1 Tax=Sandaracinobacteroides hominis TaxID=2780086 RepID=UPI002E29C27B|nr:type II toxin-antitoxin system VapC family toxin [Sandaracinobacteroides hominis]
MKLLLDTHLLLWTAGAPDRLSAQARERIGAPESILHFSAASLWEIAIKSSLGREDFAVDPSILRRALLDNGYTELPITSAHAAGVTSLPPIHRDPFDRLLVAQAMIEGMLLLTADATVAEYPGPVHLV